MNCIFGCVTPAYVIVIRNRVFMKVRLFIHRMITQSVFRITIHSRVDGKNGNEETGNMWTYLKICRCSDLLKTVLRQMAKANFLASVPSIFKRISF